MDLQRNVAVVALVMAALASCGGDDATGRAVDAASTSRSSSSSPSTGAVLEPATSATELFATIDAAVAKETSVRQEIGNLNPPPPVVVEQEYGDGADQLALTVDLGPQTDPLRIYHIDGLVYFDKDEEPKPASDIEPDDKALIGVMVRSDVRQDFQRMKEMAGGFSYLGEEDISGVTTRHYRLTLTLAAGANPATVPSEIEGPKPADLWITVTGLPVRVDVKLYEPLNGIAGTGVSRTDYSAWSEPLDLDPDDLDWD